MIAVIDNYDSFTYNLVHYLEDITNSLPLIFMNDEIDWDQLENCTHIVLSPGPGLPKTSGELMKVIDMYHDKKNILGVCLGMQALGEYFGGELKNLDEVQHGLQTRINIEQFANNKLYSGVPSTIEVGRYHSWVIDENKLPHGFNVTAKDENGNLMSMQHVAFPIYAVQYHPESIMTEWGKKILKNWIES